MSKTWIVSQCNGNLPIGADVHHLLDGIQGVAK